MGLSHHATVIPRPAEVTEQPVPTGAFAPILTSGVSNTGSDTADVKIGEGGGQWRANWSLVGWATSGRSLIPRMVSSCP